MSWLGIEDAIGAVYHALITPGLSGPVNLAAATPVTNREFSAALGRVLRRPAVLPAPGWILRLMFGEMADATVLLSTRASAERLSASGYRLRQPELERALREVLGRAD